MIELAEPSAGSSPLAEDLAGNGELPHSATFKVADLSAVEAHAEKLGVAIAEMDGHTLTLDPDDCFGASWCFTERDLPGDPRLQAGAQS